MHELKYLNSRALVLYVLCNYRCVSVPAPRKLNFCFFVVLFLPTSPAKLQVCDRYRFLIDEPSSKCSIFLYVVQTFSSLGQVSKSSEIETLGFDASVLKRHNILLESHRSPPVALPEQVKNPVSWDTIRVEDQIEHMNKTNWSVPFR